MLQDFDIIPSLLSKAQAAACFRAARFRATAGATNAAEHSGTLAPAGDSTAADLGRVTFPEFLEALGRCALLAFNFQVRHIDME
jgi:hypothetical protein